MSSIPSSKHSTSSSSSIFVLRLTSEAVEELKKTLTSSFYNHGGTSTTTKNNTSTKPTSAFTSSSIGSIRLTKGQLHGNEYTLEIGSSVFRLSLQKSTLPLSTSLSASSSSSSSSSSTSFLNLLILKQQRSFPLKLRSIKSTSPSKLFTWKAIISLNQHIVVGNRITVSKPVTLSSHPISTSLPTTPTSLSSTKVLTPTKFKASSHSTPTPVGNSTTSTTAPFNNLIPALNTFPKDSLEARMLHLLAIRSCTLQLICKKLGCKRNEAVPILKKISRVQKSTPPSNEPNYELKDEYYTIIDLNMYPKANRTSSMVVAQKCATVFKKLQVPLSHSLWKQLFPFLKHKIKLSPEKQSTESIKSSTENDTTLPPSKIRKVDENHSIALTKKNSVPPSNTSESIQKSNEELREKFDSMYEEYIDLHQFLLSSKNEINVFKNLAHTLVSSTPNSKEETLTLSELKQKATQYNANQLIQSIQKFKDLHEKLNTLRRKIIHQKCF